MAAMQLNDATRPRGMGLLITALLVWGAPAAAADVITTSASSDQSVPIPDYNNATGQNGYANVGVYLGTAPNAPIESIQVAYSIDHSYTADLVAWLSGQTVTDHVVHDRVNYASDVVTGTASPANWVGQQSDGWYFFNVADWEANDVGQITSFSVSVTWTDYAPNNFVKGQPADGAEVGDSVTFTWPHQATDLNGQAITSSIAVHDSAGNEICHADGLPANSYTCNLGGRTGDFFWQVWKTDGRLWTEGDRGAWHSVYVPDPNRPPGAFAKVSPADGAFLRDDTVTLRANTASDPDGDTVTYNITLHRDGTEVCNDGSRSSPTLTCSTAQAGEYCWQVWANDGGGAGTPANGSDNAWWCFTKSTNRPPSTFGITSPAADTQVDAGALAVTWSRNGDPDGDAVTYDVVVHDEHDATVAEATGVSAGSRTLTLPEGDGHYFVQVEAIDAYGARTGASNGWLHVWTAADTSGLTNLYGLSEADYHRLHPVTQGHGDHDCNDEIPGLIHIGKDLHSATGTSLYVPFRRTMVKDFRTTVGSSTWGRYVGLTFVADAGACLRLPDGTCETEVDCWAFHLDTVQFEGTDGVAIPAASVQRGLTQVRNGSKFGTTGGSGGWAPHLHQVCSVGLDYGDIASYPSLEDLKDIGRLYDLDEVVALNSVHPAAQLGTQVTVHTYDLQPQKPLAFYTEGPWKTRAAMGSRGMCVLGEDERSHDDGYNGLIWSVEGSQTVATATWEVNLPWAGRWQVEAFIPGNGATHDEVYYSVASSGDRSTFVPTAVDQAAYRQEWVPIATRALHDGPNTTVKLSFPPRMGTLVAADAIRATYVGNIGGGDNDLAPVVHAPTSVQGEAELPVVFSVSATDDDTPADQLTFALLGLDAASITLMGPGTAEVTWTPTVGGTFPLWVTVSDGISASAAQVWIDVAGWSPPIVLEYDELVAGLPATLRVWGLEGASDRVYVTGSVKGPGAGPCFPGLGLCSGLRSPILLGSTTGNAGDLGYVTVTVPNMPGRTVWLQALGTVGGAPVSSEVVSTVVLSGP